MTAGNKTARCPTCRAIVPLPRDKLYPFCSERCHLVDLGRWLGEEYRIPEPEDSESGGVPTPATDDDGERR